MGTTVVALLVTQKAYYIINVGDSRIYSLSDHIERLTTDQTYVQREIMNGNMTQEQAMKDPRRNVLLQCVGASAEVKPEYRTGAMKMECHFCFVQMASGMRYQNRKSMRC